MNIKKYLALTAIALPMAATAQTTDIDFESETGYTALGVYDTWENSPFRTGELTGNARVIDNPYKATDPLAGDVNTSEKVLAYQRSRFGSNTFGARIDLATPIALTSTTQYVHVKIHKPKEGRTMLIGLGKRTDWPEQSKEVVQFTVTSSQTITAGKWQDAVFAVSGNTGVNIYSLVVVTDLEPTHDLTADHVAYIDDIVVNNSSTPSIQYETYPISVDKTTTLSRTDRYTSNVKLTVSGGEEQTVALNQQTDKLLYQDMLTEQFQAKAGDTVTPSLTFSGRWMSAYVYLDHGRDGRFTYDINEGGTPADGSDIVSYSYYEGHNSKGETVANGNTLALGSFVVPDSLEPGFYRMRYKVDWNCIDPAGNTTEANGIVSNGGVIADTRLNVHPDEVSLTRGLNSEGTNGEVLTSDGQTLDNVTIPFGQPYTITLRPGDGFKVSHLVIRHGYNLDGEKDLYDTPQYEESTVPAYLINDNTYTIPARYVDGNVRVYPYFSTKGEDETVEHDDYYRNFDDSLAVTRTDRKLVSFSFTGTTSTTAQKVTIPTLSTNYVYRDLTASKEVGVVGGETVTVTTSYTTGGPMHVYLYIDLNRDGQYDYSINEDGTPGMSGEMLTYTYYNGYNSKGTAISAPGSASYATLPTFVMPEVPVGVYRARLKVDWNDANPAGHWSDGGTNNIDANGGQIVDFLLNVHEATGKLDINTVNGSLVGSSNTGQPTTTTYKKAIVLVPQPAADGYTLKQMTIRHGANIDGDRTDAHGTRQWSEFTVTPTSSSYTLRADSVNGDVRITAEFENTSSEYLLVFDEEFDTADGTQPDAAKWSRCGWNSPTWKRYTAQTEAGQKLTGYIKDGKLVLRCLANPYTDEVNPNTGAQLEMISGAVETAGKVSFTYGKIEGRLKTTGHTGNFPAFWMMPQDGSAGWPYAGEIDIWEQIDAQTTTHHTIHSGWANTTADGANCQGQTNNPAKTAQSTAALGNFHTFGLEWTEDKLTWYLNGKQVHSYAKSTDESALSLGQWPFDKPFYIIINQSVGNGSWAANRDLSYTYETEFDWVRVYQKAGGYISGINEARAESTLDVYPIRGGVHVVSTKSQPVSVADVQGRIICTRTIQGNVNIPLAPGAYIVSGHKVLVP